MSSVLIKDTTKEEREKIVNGALAIQMTGGPAPSESTMKLFQEYINGSMEIEEIKQLLIKKYKE